MAQETTSEAAHLSAARAPRPLTERVLDRVPAPGALWIAVWALVPWANAGANLLFDTARTSAVWEQNDTLVVVNYAALSLGVVIAFWGTRRIVRRLESLRAPLAEVLAGDPRDWFRELNSVSAPLTLTAAGALAFGGAALVREGWGPGLLRGSTWFVLGIPLWTYMWTYASLQLGLYRLSREPLRHDAPALDVGLRLRPLGNVAAMGLWMLLVWLVPVLLTALEDVVGVVIGAIVVIGALGAFSASMVRLHRRLVDAKESELALARDLYAEAYAPVRAERTLDALERQRSLLGAADSLEKRAHDLHDWPIDEGTFARVLTITTSVVAMAVARLILDPLGL